MLLRRVAVACVLLCSAPLLAACGGDDIAAVEVEDVIPANDEDQFERGRAAEVAIPVGRLKVWLGEPTDAVERDETRQLEALTAPAGATFVPITWRYSHGFEEAADFLGETPAPTMELVTEAERYRLPTPDESKEGGESFYVVVDGDAEDLSLEVGFDGVTQSVDLRTGERDKGRARSLYRLEADRLRSEDCDSAGWVDDDLLVAIDFLCHTTGPLLLPYADGQWARPGHHWVALRVKTTLRQWGIAGAQGGGAIYGAIGTDLEVTLDGREPVVSHEAPDSGCPVPGVGHCVVELALVFDVTDRDFDRLALHQRYNLTLASRWGGYSSDERIRGTVAGVVRLDRPGDRDREGRRRG